MDATRDRAAIAYRILIYLRFEGELDALDALLKAERYGEALRLIEDRIIRAERGFWEEKRWGLPLSLVKTNVGRADIHISLHGFIGMAEPLSAGILLNDNHRRRMAL